MSVSSIEELESLRTTVRGFLTTKSPESEVLRTYESAEGYDPALWEGLAQMLGLAGLTVPVEYDGAGAGFAELGVVLEELGRSLAPSPFFGTVVLGVQALVLSQDAVAQREHLPAIAAGRRTATMALDSGSCVDPGEGVRAAVHGSGWLLDGTRSRVIDGATADLVLVVAHADKGTGLFAVDATADGLGRTPLEVLDHTRPQARLTFTRTPAVLVSEIGEGRRIAEEVLARALAAVTAEQVGGARRVLEQAMEYARTRVQFGRAIGSFQAVKHRCAEMLMDVERAAAASRHALWAADHDPDELHVAARMAKAYCSDAYFAAAASNIRVHGGIGFTWEHSAHLYYRRAKSSQLQFGAPARHREDILRLLGI